MNLKAMINELVEIQQNPRNRSVNIVDNGNMTTYTFPDTYYFPLGIARISPLFSSGKNFFGGIAKACS